MGVGDQARLGHGDPVGHRLHPLHVHRVAGGQRRRERRGVLGLHRHHPHVRPHPAHGRGHPADQAAAPGGHQDGPHVRHLFQDLQPDRALPGDHVRVVERVDEHRAGLLGELPGPGQGLGQRVPVQVHVGAVAAGGGQLGQRRPGRHEHGGLGVEQRRGQGHALRVVAGAGRDHPARPVVLAEPVDAGVGAPDLERAGALQVLALEVDVRAGDLAQHVGRQHGRVLDHPAQQFARGADLIDTDQLHVSRSCQSAEPARGGGGPGYPHSGDLGTVRECASTAVR